MTDTAQTPQLFLIVPPETDAAFGPYTEESLSIAILQEAMALEIIEDGASDHDANDVVEELLEAGYQILTLDSSDPLAERNLPEPKPVHKSRGVAIGPEGIPYGQTHDMDCPGCQDTPFTASPRSETYWAS